VAAQGAAMTHTVWKALGPVVVLGFGLLSGCGEKITIPVAEGVFGLIDYAEDEVSTMDYEVRQIAFSAAGLHVLGADRIERRNILFAEADSVSGLVDARALCVDQQDLLVFVWEEEPHRVSWYDAIDLTPLGATDLPDVGSVVALATNRAGLEQVPWALTFLYLSDPGQGLVHRYAFDPVNGLVSHGILTRADGDAARFVHIPAGIATDSGNKLVVCDQDLERNWVIRFDSTPDTTDVTNDPNDEDPLRGLAYPFFDSGCVVPPAGDFVLGYAPQCGGDGNWSGRTGTAEGEFNAPSGVAVDGLGQIFVTDSGNNRIQMFSADGDYILQFGSEEETPDPVSLGVIDQIVPDAVHYGAYVFVHLDGTNKIVRFISAEHAKYLEQDKPIDIP